MKPGNINVDVTVTWDDRGFDDKDKALDHYIQWASLCRALGREQAIVAFMDKTGLEPCDIETVTNADGTWYVRIKEGHLREIARITKAERLAAGHSMVEASTRLAAKHMAQEVYITEDPRGDLVFSVRDTQPVMEEFDALGGSLFPKDPKTFAEELLKQTPPARDIHCGICEGEMYYRNNAKWEPEVEIRFRNPSDHRVCQPGAVYVACWNRLFQHNSENRMEAHEYERIQKVIWDWAGPDSLFRSSAVEIIKLLNLRGPNDEDPQSA